SNLQEPLLLIAHQFYCAFQGNSLKADAVAGAELAELPEIGGDDVGGLGVAAGGLVFDEEDDGLAVGGDLNCAQRDPFADHASDASAGRGERGAFEAYAHAVGFLASGVVGGVELVLEKVGL